MDYVVVNIKPISHLEIYYFKRCVHVWFWGPNKDSQFYISGDSNFSGTAISEAILSDCSVQLVSR